MNVLNAGKKRVLTGLMIAASTAMFASYASAASVSISWTGTIPGSAALADASMIITGKNGNTTGGMTSITVVDEDGTFTSPELVLESHIPDATDATVPSANLKDCNWSITSSSLTYNGQELDDAQLEVLVNGVTPTAAELDNTGSIAVKVRQSNALSVPLVAQAQVLAVVTFMVDPA